VKVAAVARVKIPNGPVLALTRVADVFGRHTVGRASARSWERSRGGCEPARASSAVGAAPKPFPVPDSATAHPRVDDPVDMTDRFDRTASVRSHPGGASWTFRAGSVYLAPVVRRVVGKVAAQGSHGSGPKSLICPSDTGVEVTSGPEGVQT
jgi:hypothetical protein